MHYRGRALLEAMAHVKRRGMPNAQDRQVKLLRGRAGVRHFPWSTKRKRGYELRTRRQAVRNMALLSLVALVCMRVVGFIDDA